MFIQGSRYRNLPESSPKNAKGERLRGKDLRIIPPTTGQFLHTVREGERLDLLAFKYYGDAAKWWQINDANPEIPFPTDLLDQRPVVKESLVLTHPDFNTRFEELLTEFSSFGEVTPSKSDFVESTVVVVYKTTSREDILNKIKGKKFRLLRTFAWDIAANTAESFTFDDVMVDNLGAKLNWQILVDNLRGMPGMLEVQSIVTEATLHLVYNSAMLSRETILKEVQTRGFALMPESLTFSRTGAKIIVPPNQIT